jgi:hypothetical protein
MLFDMSSITCHVDVFFLMLRGWRQQCTSCYWWVINCHCLWYMTYLKPHAMLSVFLLMLRGWRTAVHDLSLVSYQLSLSCCMTCPVSHLNFQNVVFRADVLAHDSASTVTKDSSTTSLHGS